MSRRRNVVHAACDSRDRLTTAGKFSRAALIVPFLNGSGIDELLTSLS